MSDSNLGATLRVRPTGSLESLESLGSLAARQHGVVSAEQLSGFGVGRGAVRHRTSTESLHRIHPGVFAVGHARLSTRGHWMAAVLAGGPGALLSHGAGGALLGFRGPWAGPIDVTVPRGSRRGPAATSARRAAAGVAFHQPRSFDPRDRSVRDGISVTTVERTLLDLAEVLDREQLRRALEEADRLKLLDLAALHSLLARSPGRHGLRPLRTLLSQTWDPIEVTRSELEDAFRHLCDRAGLPPPLTNAQVAGLEVDAFWPAHNLVVELDGYEYHRTTAAFERDRQRDVKLTLAGFIVLRFTYRQVTMNPAGTAAAIRSMLARSGD